MSDPAPPADVVARLLRALVLDVFDEHDGGKRAAAIARVFAADAEFIDPAGAQRGHAALDAAVVALHKQLPGYRFRLRSEPQVLAGAGRVTWEFGPPEDPARVRGMDVIRVENERIVLLMTFLEPSADGKPSA